MSTLPAPVLRIKYEKAADDYLRSLPLEHFMEATPQATQRKITLESFDLVHARNPQVQVFNELLVQYPLDDEDDRIGQIVPDNMVVVHDEPIVADTSYDIPLQPVHPFLVMEYVSKNSQRKDYEISFAKYEQELRVPYYLLFYPDNEEMSLFELKEDHYVSIPTNGHGRCPIPELDIEVGLLDGWVRYWFKGELLPLPADLLRELEETRRLLINANKRAEKAERRAEKAHQAQLAAEEEVKRLRAEIAKLQQE